MTLSGMVPSIDLKLAAAGLFAGVIIGLTGMGGGAVLTPLLVLVFKVPPLAAVSSDLVVSLAIKPVGALVHARHKTVRTDIVRRLALGSIPMAFAGAVILDRIGRRGSEHIVELALGVTLVTAALALVLRIVMNSRARVEPFDLGSPLRAVPTLLVGAVGGLAVGLTSVGSGSLMIVLLMWIYPRLSSAELVGTDLAQAIPLVGSAVLGHLLFGDVRLAIVGSVVIGALPGVWFGGQLSARAPDRLVRPALAAVLAASGLKLLRFI